MMTHKCFFIHKFIEPKIYFQKLFQRCGYTTYGTTSIIFFRDMLILCFKKLHVLSIMVVLFYFSYVICPILVFLFQLSCNGCPDCQAWLSCPDYHVLVVVSWLSCPSSHVLTCPFMAVVVPLGRFNGNCRSDKHF
jgi:hypothetical protein